MSVYGNTLAVTVLICVVSGCGGKFDRDTAEGWKAWAESSSEGLWGGSEEHSVELLQVKEYCGENDDFGVYIPEGLAMSGDTLFVTDTANQSITCFTVDGTVLWNSGEAGEGPGNFTTIGNITSGDDVIAVCNKALGRVDILDRYNGEWVSSVQVFWPFDVAIEHDSLYVASVGTETLISVFSISSGELLYGFGNDFWEEGSLGELSVQGNANINISIEEGKLLAHIFRIAGLCSMRKPAACLLV